MKSINLIFYVHEYNMLKRYLFFNIGEDHYYYDDYTNENHFTRHCEECYIPANKTLLDIIEHTNGKFKVSFAISGTTLELFEQFAPNVLDSFIKLSKTGKVEFLSMPYSNSAASIFDINEFSNQIKKHQDKIKQLFGYKTESFFNTAMIYSDEIGEEITKNGFRNVIVEDAKQFMGWKSSHYLYKHAYINKLNLFVRDSKLSDDINYRFSQWNWNEYPLTAEKFIKWISDTPDNEEIFNIMMGYHAMGIFNDNNSGIFNFFKALPDFAFDKGIEFTTIKESRKKHLPKDSLTSVNPISWTDEEKNTGAYFGNDMQIDAANKLYNLSARVNLSSNKLLLNDWYNLQDITHFYYMNTHHYSDGISAAAGFPYESAYHAFMNYMNILSDFIDRVNAHFPKSIEDEELNALLQTIQNQDKEIVLLKEEIKKLKKRNKKE